MARKVSPVFVAREDVGRAGNGTSDTPEDDYVIGLPEKPRSPMRVGWIAALAIAVVLLIIISMLIGGYVSLSTVFLFFMWIVIPGALIFGVVLWLNRHKPEDVPPKKFVQR